MCSLRGEQSKRERSSRGEFGNGAVVWLQAIENGFSELGVQTLNRWGGEDGSGWPPLSMWRYVGCICSAGEDMTIPEGDLWAWLPRPTWRPSRGQ